MHSDTMYVVSMCGCTFERAVHMMSDAVSDSSMHTRSDIWIRKYTPKCGMSGILCDPEI